MASLCPIALCLLVTATTVLSYHYGPPTSACMNMTPGHDPAVSSPDESPYQVTIKGKVKKYKPGQEIKVKISGDTTFKGFLLQARAADGSSTDAVGTFINVPNGTRLMGCGSADTAVSHSSPHEKKNMELTWVAPEDYDKDVVFLATVVQVKSTFWVQLSSKKLPKDICEPNPCENGECKKKKKGFKCDCDEGFTGELCADSAGLDICEPNPCENGECKKKKKGFKCDCDEGFTGELCADSAGLVDPCDPNPCEHNGVCSTTAKGKLKCKCNNGYKGKKCEKDACDPNPCTGDQTCTRTKKGKAKCK